MKFIFYSTIPCYSPGSTLDGHVNSILKLVILNVCQTGIEEGRAVGKVGVKIEESLLNELEICQLYISISVHTVFSCWI